MQQPRTSARVSLTALLGTPVTDSSGHLRGKLKDIAVATGPDAGKVLQPYLPTPAATTAPTSAPATAPATAPAAAPEKRP